MTKSKKQKTISRQKLIKKLDSVFSQFIRLRDCDDKGIVECPLCGSKVIWNGKQCQNMHFVKRGILKYRFNENNCHAGCKRCNVMLNGNYVAYTLRMQKKYGIDYVDRIFHDKEAFELKTYELAEMLQKYLLKRDDLLKQKGLQLKKDKLQ